MVGLPWGWAWGALVIFWGGVGGLVSMIKAPEGGYGLRVPTYSGAGSPGAYAAFPLTPPTPPPFPRRRAQHGKGRGLHPAAAG